GLIDIPTEEEILAMTEEIRNDPQRFRISAQLPPLRETARHLSMPRRLSRKLLPYQVVPNRTQRFFCAGPLP
ncbi:MAG: hypothetical protein II135_08115, partial [Clostridia bacterium]|nr:hypothetical protein [Clostridia bacterium]